MNITRTSFVQKFELIQVMFDHNNNCVLLNISTFLVQYWILAFVKFNLNYQNFPGGMPLDPPRKAR